MLRNVLRQTAAQCCHQHLQKRTLLGWLMYSSKKGVDRDLLAFIQQPIDMSPEAIARWAKRQKWDALKNDHKFVRDRHQTLGPDLATSHFIVKRGGAVKFVNSNRWIEKDKEGNYRLPDRLVSTFKLEAVDASNTEIMYTSFDNFVDLRNLKYLNLSNCENIDDWCIDRLQQVKRSLVCLDVSGCKHVTENGLAALHKLNLRCLRAHNMAHIKQQGLLKLMLQEVMPLCTVEGLDAPREEEEAFTATSLPPQDEQLAAHSKQ